MAAASVQMLRTLRTQLLAKLRMQIGRIVLTAINDAGTDGQGLEAGQRVTGTIWPAEPPHEDVAHIQGYGLSVVPPIGAEGLALQVGASRSHLVALLFDDPRVRPAGGAAGDVRLYHESGTVVALKANGLIEIRGDELDLLIDGDATIESTGALIVQSGGDLTVEATGALTLQGATVEIIGTTTIESKVFLGHTHTGVTTGSSDTGGVS